MLALSRHESFRYIVVGLASALIINIILIGGSFLGVNYGTSLVVAFCVSVTGAYLSHAKFTFREEYALDGFLRFVSANLLGFGLTVALIVLLHDLMDIPLWIASPATSVILFFYNYLSARWAIKVSRIFH